MGITIEYLDEEEYKDFIKNATYIKPSKELDELCEQIKRHQQKYRDYLSKNKL